MADRDLVIQIRLPRWGARKWASIALVLALVAGGGAYAGVMWTMVAAGQKLSSATINTNFQNMATAIDALNAAPAGKLPHVVTNGGNTDVGVFLGFTPLIQSVPVVYSSAVKAPLVLAPASLNVALAFDASNCTGNAAYVTAGGTPDNWFSNMAVTTGKGTVFQVTGPAAAFAAVSQMDGKGVCKAGSGTGPYLPVQDTKMPNPPTDITQLHVVLM